MVRAEASLTDAVSALREGAASFLAKPCHPSALEEALRRVLEPVPTQAGSVPRTRLSPAAALIGEHPLILAMLEKIARVADTDATVLLRGETGTGKEVIARLIHASGPQAGGPFVAVNMAALPDNLAESELFGHVRGAFTGAERHRVGRFAAAEGGTIFFDEIGDMPRGL